MSSSSAATDRAAGLLLSFVIVGLERPAGLTCWRLVSGSKGLAHDRVDLLAPQHRQHAVYPHQRRPQPLDLGF